MSGYKKDIEASVNAREPVIFNIDGTLWTRKLLTWGVETRGIVPVAIEDRTDNQYHKIFFVWFSANFNILTFSAGSLGPVAFGLGVRDSCLVILFFNLLCCALPAYFTTWGPKLGLRQMVQARYSFGYFGVILPCILNLIGMAGFCILNAILGGQTLASVANGHLSWSVGIVIISVASLLLSFCGYKVLAWYERVAWFPVLVLFLVALGVGGHNLTNVPSPSPATVSGVLSFASTIAGFVITYSPMSSDFTLYFRPKVSSFRIFCYSYLGFLVPIVSIQCLGASVAACVPLVPDWEAGYGDGDVGGLVEAMLHPVGGFGKFLTVLLSLSVIGNMAVTFYSFSLNIQTAVPPMLHVPRYVFSVLASAIVIPLSIVGATKFYTTLGDFLALIGYWAAAFCAVILVEHLAFRRNSPAAYDIFQWDQPKHLPTGIAGLGACIGSLGLVVPSMEQAWFTGPIGRVSGDIGFEMAFAVTAVLYLPLRALEVEIRKRI